MVVKTAEELGHSVNNNESTIVIEGKIGKIVIIIKGTGKVAWALALGSISVAALAVFLMVPTAATGPVAVPAEIVNGFVATGSATTAVTILGFSATMAAITMVISTRNKSILTQLRNEYDIIEHTKNKVVLKRKK